jgi:hypothetical protein
MAWVKWDSIEAFNAWHDAIKTELGLPKPSVNDAGNIVDEAIISTDYILPIIVADDDIRAYVEDVYAEDLTPSENPIVSNYAISKAL